VSINYVDESQRANHYTTPPLRAPQQQPRQEDWGCCSPLSRANHFFFGPAPLPRLVRCCNRRLLSSVRSVITSYSIINHWYRPVLGGHWADPTADNVGGLYWLTAGTWFSGPAVQLHAR